MLFVYTSISIIQSHRIFSSQQLPTTTATKTMSQDTHMFSVRRPRETLGGITNNVSAIPMPASAMKRSNSGNNLAGGGFNHGRSTSGGRHSLMPARPNQPVFQRSSNAHNLYESAPMSAQRPTNSLFGAQSTRKSYAPMSSSTPGTMMMSTPGTMMPPGTNSTMRRSSCYSRPSNGQAVPRQSFFSTAPAAAGIVQDPRRLRDPHVRGQMANELLDYFTKNNFEMESQISLTSKSLTSPTQKEFQTMFIWLYKRIDPAYIFQKSMDNEIPALLKLLRYPYEKSITKSQIAAVGGNNWHTFLGMLHWIMQLANMMDSYARGDFDYAAAEAGKDTNADRVVWNFLSASYRDWLDAPQDGNEDEADAIMERHTEQMASQFKHINKDLLEDVEMLEAEKKALTEQIEELERGAERSRQLDNKLEILKGDTTNYESWNTKVEGKIKKYADKVSRLEESLNELEKEIEDAEKEKSGYQEAISQQGITVQDLDRMSTETDRLENARKLTRERLDEAKARVAEKEAEASRKLDELERLVEKYNAMCYKIQLIPSTALNAKGVEYELSLAVNSESADFLSSQMGMSRSANQEPDLRLLRDATTGYLPHQLLNLDLRGVVKNNIVSLRKSVSERRNRALEEDMKNHEMLDGVKEAMDEKRAEVEGLEHRIRAAEEEFERTREVSFFFLEDVFVGLC